MVPGALDCDALRFEAAARRGDAAQALRLYTGELLPGFYDDWIDEERLRLAALFDRLDGAPVRTALEDAAAPDARHGAAPRHTDAARADAGASPPGHEHAVGTLPVYLTRFFGRDAEGARLRAEVLSHRLVTLLGPGGSGKTRLAVELAVSLGGPQPDTPFDFVAFVPLAGAEGREPLLDALHGSLHLRRQAGEPLAPVQAALAGRRALLVLDNFEQLAGVGEGIVAELVGTTPGLHLLVTSRRVIGLDGEREFAVRPLLLPGPGLDLGETAINPAVALFVDRARAARADFHIGRRNLAALTEIVGLLEGMPLAIELAAARVRSVTPAAMAGFLREARRAPGGRSLELLARTGPRAALDPRHASMATVIEWSWRLLDVDEAALLASLTVFRGGFAADAAHAVCGDGDGGGMLLRLDDLVAQSMLRVESLDGASSRFGLYEPIRDYASLHLDAAAAQGLRRRHRAWLAGWAASLPATPSLREVRAELAKHRRGARQRRRGRRARGGGAAGAGAASTRRRGRRGRTSAMPIAACCWRALAPWTPERDELLARALQTAASVVSRALRDAAAAEEALLDESEPLAARSGDLAAQASADALRLHRQHRHRDLARAEACISQALGRWERAGDALSADTSRYNLAVCALRGRRSTRSWRGSATSPARPSGCTTGGCSRRRATSPAKPKPAAANWAAASAAYRDSLRARLERPGPAVVRLRPLEPALSARPAALPRAGGAPRRRRRGLLEAHRRPRCRRPARPAPAAPARRRAARRGAQRAPLGARGRAGPARGRRPGPRRRRGLTSGRGTHRPTGGEQRSKARATQRANA